eukprot:GILI01004199.1.p1 GENE.GILI01004199.1~~GILI01004199.1.p1  ORF type:complete len:341 (+),score=65.55 GILI01004199.1:96-1118(+)
MQQVNKSISPTTAEELLAPFTHVCSLSSKGIRSKLVDAFNAWFFLPEALANEVKVCVDMLHNASLLIDDIEDGSELRRGAPAAHRVFGTPLTLNCANQVYFIALQKVMSLPALAVALSNDASSQPSLREHYTSNLASITVELSRIFTEEMITLHEGQGMDILWRDTYRCPSMDEYDTMVLKKTGGLFRLALRMMMTLAPPHPYLTEERKQQFTLLVETIGVFFQTLDDYLNVSNEQYHQNKTFCEDLTEGKFSYPIIHSVHVAQAMCDQRLFHILKQRPTDIAVKQFCVRLMEETGSLEATRARVESLRQDVYRTLDTIGGSPLIDECMQKMCKLMGVRA